MRPHEVRERVLDPRAERALTRLHLDDEGPRSADPDVEGLAVARRPHELELEPGLDQDPCDAPLKAGAAELLWNAKASQDRLGSAAGRTDRADEVGHVRDVPRRNRVGPAHRLGDRVGHVLLLDQPGWIEDLVDCSHPCARLAVSGVEVREEVAVLPSAGVDDFVDEHAIASADLGADGMARLRHEVLVTHLAPSARRTVGPPAVGVLDSVNGRSSVDAPLALTPRGRAPEPGQGERVAVCSGPSRGSGRGADLHASRYNEPAFPLPCVSMAHESLNGSANFGFSKLRYGSLGVLAPPTKLLSTLGPVACLMVLRSRRDCLARELWRMRGSRHRRRGAQLRLLDPSLDRRSFADEASFIRDERSFSVRDDELLGGIREQVWSRTSGGGT